MPYWHIYNCLGRVLLREVRITRTKVHSGPEIKAKKMTLPKIRKKTLAPSRLEKLRKIRYWKRSQTKLDVLTHKDTLQKVGIVHYYLLECNLIPFQRLVKHLISISTIGRPSQSIHLQFPFSHWECYGQ